MTNKTREKLLTLAVQAASKSYSPYSTFSVGAALLTKSGKVYLGCNIENASFSPTVCAERTAFFKAVSEGEREFTAIAVVGGKDGDFRHPSYPCGVCRQVMAEFCDTEFEIVLKNGSDIESHTLNNLLPCSFSLEK